jgi:hypothetical protein
VRSGRRSRIWLLQHRQGEQVQQWIELLLLAELLQADPDHVIHHQLELPR